MKTTTIKRGDVVMCIESSPCGGFIKGLKYMVSETYGPFIMAEVDSKGSLDNGAKAKLFKRSKPVQPKLPKWW